MARGGRIQMFFVAMVATAGFHGTSNVLINAARMDGHYAAGRGDKFAYLAKFAFEKVSEEDTKVSGMWEIEVRTRMNNTFLVVFDDEENDWPRIYDNDACDCNCSTGEMSHHYKFKELISPTTQEGSKHGWKFKGEVSDIRRRHWWYYTIASCGQPVKGEFSMHIHQANESEFSADQAGLFALYRTLLCFWLIITVVTLRAASQLRNSCRFHTIARLFSASVVCNTSSVLLFSMHFTMFSSDGVGLAPAVVSAEALWTIGKLFLLLALLLAARGFGITTAPLNNTERWHLFTAAAALSAVYIATAVWEICYRDEASAVYVYDLPPGMAINAVHVTLALCFGYSAALSYYHAPPELRCTFTTLVLLFGVYFLLVPLLSALGRILDPCYRVVVLESVEALVTTVLAIVVATLLSLPAACEQFLPALSHDALLGATGTYDEL